MKTETDQTAVGAQVDRRVRPLPAGAEIEYMGEPATVVADNGGPSLIVEIDGMRQEWMWNFEGTECTIVSLGDSGFAVPFSRWTPICNAPLDGSRVLLYRPGWAEDTAVCWWNSASCEWIPVRGTLFADATHWMPVPERGLTSELTCGPMARQVERRVRLSGRKVK